MEIFGIGIHILMAIFFAVHAVRNGQPIYWLLILFMFPLIGSVVYFIAIYLPSSRINQGARKVASVAVKTLDPGRELREAREAYEYTPTAQNQMRLASALLEGGNAAEAATTYEACLQGPFSGDLEIRFGAAGSERGARRRCRQTLANHSRRQRRFPRRAGIAVAGAGVRSCRTPGRGPCRVRTCVESLQRFYHPGRIRDLGGGRR